MDFDLMAGDLGFTEGPTVLPDGTLWVTSITHGALYHLRSDGSVLETVDTGGGPNGLTVDSAGVLYVAQNGGIFGGKPGTPGGIQRVENGRVEHIVTGVSAPNDLCFGPDGRLYFTDPRAASNPLDPGTVLPGRLYACDRDGSGLALLHEGIRFINGLAFTGDGDALLVAETTEPHRILRAPFGPGGLGEFEEFTTLDAGMPDGIAVADDGTVWVAATADASVHVYDASGRLVRKLSCGPRSTPTNLCFSVSGPRALYVTASGHGAVLTTSVDVKGLALGG